MDDLRKKVIGGLECQYKPRMTCYGCDYFIARDKLCNKNKIFREAVDLLKAEEAKPLRCGGCSWFTQTQESGVGYCSLQNHEREVFDTEYCSWGAWTGKEG